MRYNDQNLLSAKKDNMEEKGFPSTQWFSVWKITKVIENMG